MESNFDEVMKHLRAELQGIPASKSGCWKRYDDTLNSMSSEQKAWISKQEAVIKAKNIMYTSFFEYLFDINKDAFASVGDGKYKGVVDSYIDTIQKSATSYVSHAEELEKENRELKDQIKKILEERNERSTAERTGRNRKENTDKAVRSNGNTLSGSQPADLFSFESEQMDS